MVVLMVLCLLLFGWGGFQKKTLFTFVDASGRGWKVNCVGIGLVGAFLLFWLP
jgi:hypothetical protein